jgi:zinc transport system substrate-binding protein
VNRLSGLDREFTAGLQNCQRREFVTSHAAFGYVAERYHLDEIAVNGVNPESEPSPARRADIQKLARDKGVTTIFFETLAEPKTAKTLAQDLKVQTAVLDPLEGIEDEATNDYFSVMRANLDALRKGLGCS